jgi:hypothetical protein
LDVKTERPTPEQIQKAVEVATGNGIYRKNVETLCNEFCCYKPNELCENYVRQVLPHKRECSLLVQRLPLLEGNFW